MIKMTTTINTLSAQENEELQEIHDRVVQREYLQYHNDKFLLAGEWYDCGLSDEEAREWQKKGFLLQDAMGWVMSGFEPEEAEEVKAWIKLGVTPEDASDCRCESFTPEDIKDFFEHGVPMYDII